MAGTLNIAPAVMHVDSLAASPYPTTRSAADFTRGTNRPS